MAWLRFDAIRRAVGRVRPRAVVELGCGEGAMATWLASRAGYVGVERDDAARAVAAARLLGFPDARLVSSLADVPRRSADLACAFEVLEHIEDDAAALAQMVETLRPGGSVLLSVPADPARFGPSDTLVGHLRRYSRGGLVQLLERAELVVESFESYGAGAGHVLDRVQDAVAQRHLRASSTARPTVDTAGSGRYRQPASRLDATVRAGLAAPLRVAQMPFRSGDVGVGYVVLARAGGG